MFEKILILAEDTKLRGLLYEVLSSMGHSVITLPSANEAIKLLDSQKPNLIIIDKAMSHASVEELAKNIKGLNKEIRIIILAEEALPDEETSNLLSLGVSSIIKKDFSSPFMLKEIFNVLKEPLFVNLPKKYRGEILVVDDESETREVLANFFEKRGYQVSQAGSGEEAVYKINVKKPHLVLLDIRMPGMDGLVVLNRIKDIDSSIQVIMISGLSEKHIAKEAIKIGACGFILKPFDIKDLEALIASVFITAPR